MKLFNSFILGLLIFFIVLVSFPQIETNAQPRTIVVSDDYTTIQEAIDNSVEGDTILVMKIELFNTVHFSPD